MKKIDVLIILDACRYDIFEQVYKDIKAGEYLSADKITELYRDARRYYYGNTVEFLPNQDKYWTFISMFYSSWRHYYNYQYAFGQLFVQILYAKYREDKEAFVATYKSFLSAGSSQAPDQLIKLFDLDLHNPAIWNIAFQELQREADEIEKLLGLNDEIG